MNWKNEAANDLSTYTRKKESLENMKRQIQALNMQFTAVKGAMSDTGPVCGGESKYEDRLLDNVVKRDRLKLTYVATKRILDLIEKGIAGLDDKEKFVIEKFYTHRTRDKLECCMNELHIEKSQVYRIKDDALYKFTITMYGIIEY